MHANARWELIAARVTAAALSVAVVAGALLVLVPEPGIDIVRRAANIPDQAEGLEGFVNASNALVSPALVAMAAVAPLACVIGAGAVMLGSRRGLPIIGAALGALVFLGSVKGIVA